MAAPLSDEDKTFVRAILNNPGERTAWLVYADWLDERDDPRAEFIRLEIRRRDPDSSRAERLAVAARLAGLRRALDPRWVALFDGPAVENCEPRFAFKCPKQWEELAGTADPLVRDCSACHKQVHYCLSVREAYDHARQGHCVAVALGVPRSPGDLRRDPDHLMHATVGVLIPRPAPPPPPPKKPWWKFW